jgi:signal transduction histidine kinase
LFGIGIAAVMIIGSIYIIQLLEAKKNLEFKVAERTEKLKDSLEKLHQFQQQLIIKEKQASLGTLSGRIAHQIKNPLSLIDINISSSLIFLRQLEEIIEENKLIFEDIIEEIFQNNEEVLFNLEEKLTDSQEQVIRINQIIQDVLSYFRQEQLAPSLTDLNSLIDKVLQLVARQYQGAERESPVRLVTNFDSSIERIEIVEREIEKALINLLENAYYTVLSQQKKDNDNYIPTITVQTRNLFDRIEIRIRDNGEGIAENTITKIFEPFWTTKPALEGTGLGLFFAHQIIVGIHKGEILVDSTEGEYTEFIVFLPLNID